MPLIRTSNNTRPIQRCCNVQRSVNDKDIDQSTRFGKVWQIIAVTLKIVETTSIRRQDVSMT